MARTNSEIVMGIHPTAHGLGWVLFEGPFSPIDWGIMSALPKRLTRLPKRLERIMNRYHPAALIMEPFEGLGSVRVERMRWLCKSLHQMAASRGMRVHLCSLEVVKACFAKIGALTRYDIALAIAKRIEALDHRLPPKRRSWMNRDPRQALFDAAALLMTYFASRGFPLDQTVVPPGPQRSIPAMPALRSPLERRNGPALLGEAETAMSDKRASVYEAVTSKIVAAMENGATSYSMPWHAPVPLHIPTNAQTGKPYRGTNIVALWIEASARGYISGEWASYRQWKSLDAQVRGGEKGTVIVYYRKVEAGEEKEDDEKHASFVLRTSVVFNAEQVDGYRPALPALRSLVEVIDSVEAFVLATKADIRHGGSKAQYRLDRDCIELPERERFIGTTTLSPTEAYYAVLLHELTHWSGAAHRLNRQFGKRFGDEAYAMEELVAELGSAFLCASLGITNEPRADHSAYVGSWLNILGSDHKAIFSAAAKAQEAVQFLTGLASNQC